jgi:hypothetical protein
MMDEYSVYNANIAQQIFGEQNFRKMELMLVFAFVSDADQNLTVNPSIVDHFAKEPHKLHAVTQALQADLKPALLLIASERKVHFWDPVREKNIEAPGLVYYVAAEELNKFAQAA